MKHYTGLKHYQTRKYCLSLLVNFGSLKRYLTRKYCLSLLVQGDENNELNDEYETGYSH